ncbi:MAG: hypothetical protein MJZ15_07385 [Bacteroidales bacterium]|nr:hypothetical protein [Bacteroidales bacterium]
MVRKIVITLIVIVANALISSAQYSDTLTVTRQDSINANKTEAIMKFGYLAPHVDPQIIYAQYFWATNRFNEKLTKNNNPFQMIDQNGKPRKFRTIEEAIARFTLAMADYDIKKESYTDYLERKPKTNWTPRMSKKLLEIYKGLYGSEYNHKKQLHTWKTGQTRLQFAKYDSLGHDETEMKYGKGVRPYDKAYAITATDKSMIQPRISLGPLQPLANKVDTGLIFIHVLWATNHFNEKSIRNNNLFQIVDYRGNLMEFDSWQAAIADYLLRIIDYDKNTESYLAYLERRSGGQWNKTMSDKMRKLYRSLFHKDLDESGLKGYQKQEEKRRTSSARSRNRL